MITQAEAGVLYETAKLEHGLLRVARDQHFVTGL
jgi:hypothetical protein